MIRCRNGSWFVRWRENGKQKQKHFGTGEQGRKKAEVFNLQMQLDKKLGQPIGSHPDGTREVFIDELCQYVLDDRRAKGRSEKYIHEFKAYMNRVLIPALSHKPVDKLTYQDDIVPLMNTLRYKDPEKKIERSQVTRNRDMDLLRIIFIFGVENEITKNNPLRRWKKTKEKPRDIQLNLDDLRTIQAHASPHTKWAIEVAYQLGVRCGESELLALMYSNIDREAKQIKVYGRKTKTYRVIPLSNEFLAKLLEMAKTSVSGFIVEYKGRPVKSLKKSFERACKKAEIPYPVRFYDVRHLAASSMIANGADIASVSKILGHSSIKMTADVYYHSLSGEKRRAIDCLPKL